jgi:hypothetical protein
VHFPQQISSLTVQPTTNNSYHQAPQFYETAQHPVYRG